MTPLRPMQGERGGRAGRACLPALLWAAACSSPLTDDDPRSHPHQSNAGVDWRDQVIYQIVVDRFANGDLNNDRNVEPGAPGRHHGGDWRGVIDHLDYLEGLGVTALWISPVVKNVEEDSGFASYHGYWTQDPLRPNPHFGDEITLRELVEAAHERDLLVLLDIVPNHIGPLFYYDINGNGRPDETLTGGGTSHTCVQICNHPERAHECSDDERTYCEQGISYFERISEWDPDYDPRGVQGWTSGGFSGPAEIRFHYQPHINRNLPERPPSWLSWPDDRGWFDDPTWFNRRGRVYTWWHEGDYSYDFVREQETLGDFVGGLKDLATDRTEVQEALIRSYTYWMDLSDADGFRVDAAKHIDRPESEPDRRGFFGTFATAIRDHARALGKERFLLVGEVFDGSDTLGGAYTRGGTDAQGDFGRLDSVFYFSMKYRVIDAVFKRGEPTRNLECLTHARLGVQLDDPYCTDNGFATEPTYGTEPHPGGVGLAPSRALVSFLDNHDTARFLFEGATVEMLHNALFFLFTWDGLPSIYYGTEQGFDGGTDPRNREDMVFDTDQPTYRWIASLAAMRRDHVALRRGDVTIRWTTTRARGARDHGIIAFERSYEDETALVLLNVAADQASEPCAPETDGGACASVSFSPGTLLVDVAPGSDGETVTVSEDGTVEVEIPALSGRLFVPQ